MKQNNFFTSLSPLARTTLIICLIALPILIISTVFIVLAVANNKGNDTNQVALNLTSTVLPSVTNTPNNVFTSTISPTTLNSNIYYYKQLDITINIPAGYELDNYENDTFFQCSEVQDALKMPVSCKEKIVYPYIGIKKLDSLNSILTISAATPGGVGGECEKNSLKENYPIKVKGLPYNYSIFKQPNGTYCNVENRLISMNTTGSQSVWKNLIFQISPNSKSELLDYIHIIENIK